MREIKFKGKRIDNDEWVYGFYFTAGFNPENLDHYIRTNDGNSEVNPESVGQYTGLKDKKGREIYEGDIIQLESDKRPWVIEMDRGCFGAKGIALRALKEVKVIGNIYENSELINKDPLPW